MIELRHIKNEPEKHIKWMCHNIFITTDNQVVNQGFNLLKEQLIGGSYCFFVNGKYRTKKWIQQNCVKVIGMIYNY